MNEQEESREGEAGQEEEGSSEVAADSEDQTSSVRLCGVCNKRIPDPDSASLTQWIFSLNSCKCRSDLQEIARQVTDRPQDVSSQQTFEVCRKCNKRIKPPTEGSLTQWIFESHRCTCEVPDPVAVSTSPKLEAMTPDEIAPPPEYQESAEILAGWDPELKRYAPIEQLGQGASGAVYLCYDKVLQRAVAIKHLVHASSDHLIAFQNEARIASRLKHPSIVQVLDFGVSAGGTPFMVMDYLEGESLSRYLEVHGQLDPDTAIDLMKSLCEALDYSHYAGVYHHDIKSSNVLMVKDEAGNRLPVLIDLGVARLDRDTHEKERLGSAGYMAPDYIGGGIYDRRSEIYSLGCLFFEMLTGSLPFAGDSLLETLEMHKSEPLPELSERRPDLDFPDRVDSIIRKCLEKEPEVRYQTTSALNDALSELRSASLQSTENQEESFTSQPSPGDRKGLYVGLSCTLALVFVGLAVYLNHEQQATISNSRQSYSSDAPLQSVANMEISKPRTYKGTRFVRTVNKLGQVTFTAADAVNDTDLARLDVEEAYKIDLGQTKVTSAGLRFLEGKRIDTLELSDTEIDDRAGGYLSRVSALKELHMRKTAITDNFFDRLSQETMRTIKVDGCAITDRGLETICRKWPGLIHLNISGTSVTSKGIELIGSLKDLYKLDLAELDVTPHNLRTLSKLNIQSLNITNVQLNDEAVAELLKFEKLNDLLMADNQLSEENRNKLKTRYGKYMRDYVGAAKDQKNLTELSEFIGSRGALDE